MSKQNWVALAKGLADGSIPFSRATCYRLARDGLITLRKVDGRVSMMQREIDSILRLLKSRKGGR